MLSGGDSVRMWGLEDFLSKPMAACEHRKVARAFTPSMRSKRLAGVASVGVRLMALALFTRISSPPNVFAVSAKACTMAASSRTSSWIGSALPPAASISAATLWIVPASFGCGSAVLAATTTLAPSLAARSAISRPMPRDAPVISSVLALSVFMGFQPDVVRGGDDIPAQVDCPQA